MAAMWTLIIKNNSAVTPRDIEDLGITIGVSTQITMSDQFEYQQLASSDDLRDHVQNGNLIVNDGSSDLSAVDGVLYLTLYNAKKTADNFYTKTSLQTGGQSSIHWDNITNAPAFGSTTWLEPALARVQEMSAAGPTVPSDGMFFIDTDDDHLYKRVTGAWVDQGAPTAGDRVIALDSTAQMIFEWSGSAWSALADNASLDAILINDDGDGKQAQYIYDSGTLSWIKIADIDYGEPNDLDGAYDQGGAGAGRTINVDSGAVKFDTGVATNAPIEITQKASLPTTGLAAGQMAVKGGILCCYDGTRSKWMSVQRLYLVFGRKGNTANQYLEFGAGGLPSINSGLRMAYSGTIVGITCQLDASGTTNIRIRKNDSTTNIATLAVSGAVGATDNAVNIDFSQNDFIQCYSDNASNVADPIVIVEIAYRP